MKTLKLKVCGMKYKDNIEALVQLQPDFIGFIFYPASKRFVNTELDFFNFNKIPASIVKVGVFVNASKDHILSQCRKYTITAIQLHGDELPDFCSEMKKEGLIVIKAFPIDNKFNFDLLTNYEMGCDYFLFDTKSSNYGGTGQKFDWDILKGKNIQRPYFLSGGIDLQDASGIVEDNGLNIFAIDINSRFEIEAGLKDIEKIKEFKLLLQ